MGESQKYPDLVAGRGDVQGDAEASRPGLDCCVKSSPLCAPDVGSCAAQASNRPYDLRGSVGCDDGGGDNGPHEQEGEEHRLRGYIPKEALKYNLESDCWGPTITL